MEAVDVSGVMFSEVAATNSWRRRRDQSFSRVLAPKVRASIFLTAFCHLKSSEMVSRGSPWCGKTQLSVEVVAWKRGNISGPVETFLSKPSPARLLSVWDLREKSSAHKSGELGPCRNGLKGTLLHVGQMCGWRCPMKAAMDGCQHTKSRPSAFGSFLLSKDDSLCC